MAIQVSPHTVAVTTAILSPMTATAERWDSLGSLSQSLRRVATIRIRGDPTCQAISLSGVNKQCGRDPADSAGDPKVAS